jgi:predicted Holliday junction resolvase-like endonuclease
LVMVYDIYTIILLVVGWGIIVVLSYLIFKNRFEKWKQESLDKQRSVTKGRMAEQLAPLLPEFKYNPSDARFLGNPIDYIIFENLHKEGEEPINIVLLDVKTGKASLNRNERLIEKAANERRIKFETLQLGTLEE